MKKALLSFIIITLACQIVFANRHKYHTSFTRIDYNKKENLLEVSIKVFAHDLLPTLNKLHKKKIDLENTENIDDLLTNYLANNFVIKTKDGETKSFKWLGKELETDVIRFYVEIPFDNDLQGAEIKNTMFFESFREQVNLLSIRFDGKKADLAFKVGDNFKVIKENPKKN